MNMPDPEAILTVQEVAEYLRLGEATIYRLAQDGIIPAMKVGRSWRFKKGLIDEWFRLGGITSTDGRAGEDLAR